MEKKSKNEWLILLRDKLTFERWWVTMPGHLTEEQIRQDHISKIENKLMTPTAEIFGIFSIDGNTIGSMYSEYNAKSKVFQKTDEYKTYWKNRETLNKLKDGAEV